MEDRLKQGMRSLLLAKYLRQARLKQTISRKELAKTLGYHTQYIANWESGRCKPPLKSLYKLSKVLKIPPSRLMQILKAEYTLRLRAIFKD